MTPPCPTAKTSSEPLPHTAYRSCVTPEFSACQLSPSLEECRITPLSPTTKTSSALVPQTASRVCVVPDG